MIVNPVFPGSTIFRLRRTFTSPLLKISLCSSPLHNNTSLVAEYPRLVHQRLPHYKGLALGADSPPAEQHSGGTLGVSAVRILIGLTLLIPAFSLKIAPPRLRAMLHCNFNAPLPSDRSLATHRTCLFGRQLEPRFIFRAKLQSRPVSCYAFFKGWLLLSQPPGCQRNLTSFHT